MIADVEELSSAEAIERVVEFMSTLPTENGWNSFQPRRLYEGIWTFPHFLESIILAQHRFKPKPGDIFLCSATKSEPLGSKHWVLPSSLETFTTPPIVHYSPRVLIIVSQIWSGSNINQTYANQVSHSYPPMHLTIVCLNLFWFRWC